MIFAPDCEHISVPACFLASVSDYHSRCQSAFVPASAPYYAPAPNYAPAPAPPSATAHSTATDAPPTQALYFVSPCLWKQLFMAVALPRIYNGLLCTFRGKTEEGNIVKLFRDSSLKSRLNFVLNFLLLLAFLACTWILRH